MTEQTDIPRLTGEQLLELMVAIERRNRQRRHDTDAVLAPYPPCPVCRQPVDAQSATLGTADVDDRVLTVQPCGHRATYSLKVAQQFVGRAKTIVDQEDQPCGEEPAGGPLAGRLAELDALEDGWLDGRGKAPSPRVLEAAGRLAAALPEAIGPVDVYPTEVGGVQLEWGDQYGDHGLEIRPDLHLVLLTVEREVAAARTYAAEMRDFCSPHGVSVHYADQLEAAMDRAKEGA